VNAVSIVAVAGVCFKQITE